jgi:hypothetical protein
LVRQKLFQLLVAVGDIYEILIGVYLFHVMSVIHFQPILQELIQLIVYQVFLAGVFITVVKKLYPSWFLSHFANAARIVFFNIEQFWTNFCLSELVVDFQVFGDVAQGSLVGREVERI